MKFLPKKDWRVGGIFVLILVFMGSLVLLESSMPGWIYLIEFIPVALLGWMWFGTFYLIQNKTVIYRSGPFQGTVPISSIIKIRKNEYSWVGTRPSLSLESLKITYNKNDELYIAPEEEDQFIQALLQVNSKILIEN